MLRRHRGGWPLALTHRSTDMSTQYPTGVTPELANRPNESPVSAASWPAIFAGAITAAATSLILVALGSGIGLASISPWPHSGASATTFTVMTAIWLIVVQWLSALIGGYMTGRLRTKWVGTHTHEVFFRDTAHGFVTWALATVIGAALLASAVGTASETGVRAASNVASGVAQGATASLSDSVTPYDVDRLLRPASAETDTSKSDGRAEVSRILAKGISTGDVAPEDRDYLTKLVAARTGVSEAEAQKRVNDIIAAEKAAELKAREAADVARKAAATTSIFMALSMLIGAFIASASAALGGRLRDLHP
jgi:hypothetical protein